MGLIFIIHEVQNEDSLSRQFCSPVLDRDKMIKSSAYNREFSFAPFGKTKGSDNAFSNAKGRSLIQRLKSSGLKIQSCRAPLA